MEKLFSFFSSYWWILVLVISLILWKPILRLLFGMIVVPDGHIGLVTKKFVLFGANKSLPDGRIIATKGEAGAQAEALPSNVYWFRFPWQYSVTMQPFVVIPEGKIGLILAKDGAPMPTGAILGTKVECNNFQDVKAFLENDGQKGRQAAYITAGTYRINLLAFDITLISMTHINENMVGIITTLDGKRIEGEEIAGENVEGHNNFQDFDKFLEAGGNRGLQPQVILAGSYNLNTWAMTIEETPMTTIPIGFVGVAISYIGKKGKDLSGEDFKHGNIVTNGERGVWVEPYGPGRYPINKYTTSIEIVQTTNLVLNWASARTESHKLDANLSTIKVRSQDGFEFTLDVSQIIHIPSTEAPKVIARFGSVQNLVSQVLEPTIGNYFRNSAQKSDAIAFLNERSTRQNEAKAEIAKVLGEYNVNAVDTLIGDIVPPAPLMKTLTDRKIAQEEQKTFVTQKEAQVQRQGMEKETAIADMQKQVVAANQGVEIAEKTANAKIKEAEGSKQSEILKADGQATARVSLAKADAEAVKLAAGAEAEKIEKTKKADATGIEAVGKATAESYKLQVEAMGQNNFANLKVTEQLSTGNLKLMPDILINGTNGEGGATSGLLAMQLAEMIKLNKEVKG